MSLRVTRFHPRRCSLKAAAFTAEISHVRVAHGNTEATSVPVEDVFFFFSKSEDSAPESAQGSSPDTEYTLSWSASKQTVVVKYFE